MVRGRRAAIANADKLGAALIGPLGLQGRASAWSSCRTGRLHYLPFQALRVDGKYLIETHPVSVAPSMSIAVQLAQRSPRADAVLTAFGNPRIEDKYDLPGAETEVQAAGPAVPAQQRLHGRRAPPRRSSATSPRARR